MFHVTKTSAVKRIQRLGILPMQTSNWINAGGARYGNGEIFACELRCDAIRWAAKMDWEFNQTMGSGKISIVEFHDAPDLWEVDESDPISRAGNKGRWLKKHGSVPASQIKAAAPVVVAMIRAEATHA